ncbi:MAG: hypothetical protein K0S46_2689 [Moraxellaceae bacterium]|jgi:hypothetical protein|nr:hypothetical protein [Moraxellaceae bacterium]
MTTVVTEIAMLLAALCLLFLAVRLILNVRAQSRLRTEPLRVSARRRSPGLGEATPPGQRKRS